MDNEEPLAFDDLRSDSDATVGGRSCAFDPAGARITTRDSHRGAHADSEISL